MLALLFSDSGRVAEDMSASLFLFFLNKSKIYLNLFLFLLLSYFFFNFGVIFTLGDE